MSRDIESSLGIHTVDWYILNIKKKSFKGMFLFRPGNRGRIFVCENITDFLALFLLR
jgi:hypothetical protein